MKKKTSLKDSLIFCLGIILIAVIVLLAGKLKGDSIVFPDITQIARAFFNLLSSGHTYTLILTTLARLLISLLISAAAGITIGLAGGLCPFIHRLLSPLMILLRSIPIIVLAVIIMVLCDYAYVPCIAAVMVLVPVISEAAFEGCRRIDRELIDVYRLNSSFTPRILFSVYLPLMAGYLKQAYVNAAGTGIKIIVTAEYLVQAKNSLGKEIYSSAYFSEYADIYAYALIMILLVLMITELPLFLIRKFSKDGSAADAQ